MRTFGVGRTAVNRIRRGNPSTSRQCECPSAAPSGKSSFGRQPPSRPRSPSPASAHHGEDVRRASSKARNRPADPRFDPSTSSTLESTVDRFVHLHAGSIRVLRIQRHTGPLPWDVRSSLHGRETRRPPRWRRSFAHTGDPLPPPDGRSGLPLGPIPFVRELDE